MGIAPLNESQTVPTASDDVIFDGIQPYAVFLEVDVRTAIK